MIKRTIFLLLAISTAVTVYCRNIKPIEGSYYGTNYTVPFAHAYRALGEVGVDRKSAIDRDVYHMARLGLNAYRIHLWDVEISDSIGNLIDNDHLDLLDYLIAQLEKRGIKTIITAQTNFGNGYPEKNTDPYGAYSYKYDKCEVHDNPAAQKAQANYLGQLVRHVNRYTGRSYADDPDIIAMEINNEPCHSGDRRQVTEYIDKMAKALHESGWDKTILYNVSHNLPVADAYFDADIDGITSQWYPLNLVGGHTKKGNFMPYLDQYDIPFKGKKGYNELSKVIYEYDPADNLLSYLFPAAARTFRKEGFDWVTQFAYDPIDIAWANTEYQTHYLNLAYTPQKALGMMVAAEITKQLPKGADFGKYPNDTIFGDFLISARHDLAMTNDGNSYIYTNNTDIAPKDPSALKHIAGYGTSPLVVYNGRGAYFIDKINDNVWRLEVMPDVVITQDPFAKPSLQRRVGEIIFSENPMTLRLPGLTTDFKYKSLTEPQYEGTASLNRFSVVPGVYLLADNLDEINAIDTSSLFGKDNNLRISEYVSPEKREVANHLVHTPKQAVWKDDGIEITLTVTGDVMPDSVVVYPADVSFWRDSNTVYPMDKIGNYDYSVHINPQWGNKFDYNIVVFRSGSATTYPGEVPGTPLDWDFIPAADSHFSTRLLEKTSPIVLLSPEEDMDGSIMSPIPADWHGIHYRYSDNKPFAQDALVVSSAAKENPSKLVLHKYIGDILENLPGIRENALIALSILDTEGVDKVEVGLVDRNGFTFSKTITPDKGIAHINTSDLKLSNTLLVPDPYPTFLTQEFIPDKHTKARFDINDVEKLNIVVYPASGQDSEIKIGGVWIE